MATRWYPLDDMALLGGSWAIERTFTDRGATFGEFTGTLLFAVDGAVLHYREHGTLFTADRSTSTFRNLDYHVTGPGQARVTFDDGRHFHDVDLRTGEYDVVHPCAADVYQGRYELLDADTWHQQWMVDGPAKAYRIDSQFTRTDKLSVM